MDLLVNKYRPTELADVLGNSLTIETLSLIIKNNDMPHLLFTGPPGTGKTTSAKILATKLLVSKTALLELNASDDRGIDVVRTTIKNFAQQRHNEPYKIIILDEADSMTTAAQQAMRRVMEIYSADCKFILICNTFSKISEPIQSRCAVLKFERISTEVVIDRLRFICKKEEMEITPGALKLAVELSDGDMRQALNLLQSFYKLDMKVDEDYLIKIVGQPSPKIIQRILKLLLNKNIEEALELFDDLWKDKFEPEDIIGSFFRTAKNMELYEVIRVIGLTHMRIVEGVNSKLQFYGLFNDIIEL